MRVICSFTSDIYKLAEMIGNQSDLKVLSIKDYIKNPKESGYKSYHMLVSVPIFLSDSVVDTKVEIQIRTIAMDFWASLEHKIYYKFEGNARSTSAGTCGNARRWSLRWMRRCCRSTRRYRRVWKNSSQGLRRQA